MHCVFADYFVVIEYLFNFLNLQIEMGQAMTIIAGILSIEKTEVK